MCTIIFVEKIPLQFQIKPELHGPHGYQGSVLDLLGIGGLKTPCLTRNETLVTVLLLYMYMLTIHVYFRQ
jgi:hypothetical protein